MSDRYISSVHIQKLGHKIQEIRERALFSIISKLEHGFVYDNDLARCKEILWKLFEWFSFEPCDHQNTVLNLIQRILKSESGTVLINHYGTKAIAAEIRQIRSYIEPKFYPIVDELLVLIEGPKKAHVDVPPLQSDLPLSYRSHETDGLSTRTYTVGSTMTPIEGFIQHGSSVEQQTGRPEQTLENTERSKLSSANKGILFTHFTLKWQPLIAPDRHVIESVEQSLRNPTEPSSLLHSCEFFANVMLQDFPAEVFLQRPAIILLFHDYLKSSTSARLTNSILNCLLKLTKHVVTRIYYYRDPCVYNLKQTVPLHTHSEVSTPVSPINLTNTEGLYMHNVRSESSYFTSEDEDTAALKTKQLSVPQYCFASFLCLFDYICIKPEHLKEYKVRKKQSQSGINLSLVLLDELICLLSLCLKTDVWNKKSVPIIVQILHNFEEVLVKFSDVLEHFRLEVMSNNFDKSNRATHLHLLCSCSNLLVKLIPLSKADYVLPRTLKSALANILLDSALARLFPTVHETIFQFVKEFGGRFETESITKYWEIKSLCDSFTAAITFLRNPKSLPVLTAIKLVKEGLKSLEFHKNLTYMTMFVSLCANKLPLGILEEDTFKFAEEVVLMLLAHSNIEIREEMYRLCSKRVIAVVGTNLNVSGTGAPGSQILFLLRAPILIEICLHGATNENKQIQKYAEDILIHILKSKILVSEEVWNQTVQALIPAFPILTCYAGKNSALGRTVVSMFDPDAAKSLNIPSPEVLKGNLRLLFVDDALTREEAVSRLCWLMGSQAGSRDLLPRLNSLQDKALGTVCQLQRINDINKGRPSQHFYQPSSLYQVLELLNSESVEPVIRRSALTQISVMLEDPLLHHTFLELDGVKTLITIMRSALTENNYRDYVDCIIPAVLILKNVCLYNSSIRHELSNNLDVYFYVLRGLFIFCSEDRMRQDSSILLCLLLFCDYILGSPAKVDLSLPYLINDKLSLPFTCNMHWHTSKHTLPSLAATLLSDKWCLSCIQIHWNSEWFGGFREILNWEEIKYSESQLSEFSEHLRLSNVDLTALKSSSLDYCISECLTDIQNATSHNAVIDAVGKLTAYGNLYTLTKHDVEIGKKDLLTFPWQLSFSRFLNAPPANEEDILLLTAIIKFLVLLVPQYTLNDEPCWIITLLKDSSHCLPNLLQVESSPEFELKILHQELLNLITVSVWHEQQFVDLLMTTTNKFPETTWLHVIEIIADNLKFSDTEHFYNLAYLDAVLSCLVHLTTALGWSQSKANSIPKEPIPGLILGLCELVGAFHCGKGPSAAVSVMGLSITRNVLLILNHLLAEMQCFNLKGWEMCFIGESAVEENVLYTLCALWLSRDVVLRAAILQLLAGLTMSPRASIELVQGIRDVKTGNGIWETALMILLDHEEPSIVRENAASILGNLISHTMPSSTNNIILIANLMPVSMKKSNNLIGAILNLLEDYKFYKELEIILSCLYICTTFYLDGDLDSIASDRTTSPLGDKGEFAFAYTKNIVSNTTTRSTSSKSTFSTSASSKNPTMVVTPGFVKAVTIFIHNLLILAEEEVTNILQEYGLIKMFFRSLSSPLINIDNTKDLSLYCDILQMNTAICGLLNKAVSNNQMCVGTVLHTRDCLNVMLSLLNPAIYHVGLPHLVYLRNKLWTEVFSLIGVLLDSGLQKTASRSPRSSDYCREAFTILSSILNECGHQPFLQTLCEAVSSSSSLELQLSALTSLTSLLRTESAPFVNDFKTQSVPEMDISMQNMLDNVKTPRTPSVEENLNENIENIEPKSEEKMVEVLWHRKPKTTTKQSHVLENAYFERINRAVNELNKKRTSSDKLNKKNSTTEKNVQPKMTENGPLMAGAELCRILLHLYEISNIRSKDKYNKRKAIIVNTLTSILCVSCEAKKLALQNGLMETIIHQLQELHVKLSLESVECIRRVNDKKRLHPIFKELGSLVGLITNFMLGDEGAKCAASVLGLADLIHKLWVWFSVDRSLQSDVLKMLCTYTTDCYVACQSLPLTSSVAGSGPRKVPSNFSLLHEVIGLIFKEMELVSRMHDLTMLELAFHILHNSCTVVECRNVLAKSNILQCLSRLHPAITKRQKPWENVELICLEFLLTITGYTEGQTSLAKATDALEIIMMLTSNAKMSIKKTALLVLRNIAFYQPNRPRLLNSDDFLNILQTKLTNGSTEEKYIVATIMWALSANSQKAKLVLKCAGLDVRLQECIKQFSLFLDENVDPKAIDTMQHVLRILKEGEKGK